MIKYISKRLCLSIYYRFKTAINEYIRDRDLSALFHALDIKSKSGSIVVVGCNSGQEVKFYNRFFSRIDLIDPLIPNLKMHRACRTKNVHLHAMAVSNISGIRSFFIADNGGESSSLSQPTHHLSEYPEIAFKPSNVIAKRLSDLDFFTKAMVLMLDVQGGEIDVLKSAQPIGLGHLSLIICEYSLVPLYENSGVLDDLILLLQENGFSLAFTTSPYLSKGECTGDAIFIRKDFFS